MKINENFEKILISYNALEKFIDEIIRQSNLFDLDIDVLLDKLNKSDNFLLFIISSFVFELTDEPSFWYDMMNDYIQKNSIEMSVLKTSFGYLYLN